jgi:hypothetical protein
MSGGVKIAEKIRIPMKKYFLFFVRIFKLRIFNFVKSIKSIGNSNERPLVNNKNIENFIYSE